MTISTSEEVNQVLENIKLFAFDMDGVIRIGTHPVEGAEKIFPLIEKLNQKSLIITNECRYTPEEIIEDLTEMGIQFPPSPPSVLTAGQMVKQYITEKSQRFPDENISIGIIGEQGLYDTINPITQLPNVEICETPPKYKTKNFLIVGTLNKIKISNLEKTLKWVKSNAKIILTCDDVADPSSKGDFTLGMPKHILHMTNFNVKTSPAYSCGKPNPIVARKILEQYPDIKPEEVLLIGDTLYTDIRLAEENNFKSLLVLSGNTKKEGIKSYVTEADIILNSIKDLYTILKKKINPDSPM
jgi:HAD superfamily hydrolase (TIGR01450 family)